MRALAVEDGVEAADEHRVGERPQREGLAPEAAQRVLVVDEVRAHHLDHDERVQLVVPGEVRLVAAAAAQQPDARAARGDLVAFREVP